MTRGRLVRAVITVAMCAGFAAVSVSADPGQQKGRYKADGDTCIWDENDTGPNQCEPVVPGRFKQDGDACVWDSNGRGADQCKPASGRWKRDGDRCAWDAKDSGPNQCDPRQRRPS